MLVLVAEPEAELRSVLIYILSREGYEVVASSRGLRIESLVIERQAAALIVDLALPDVDGLALCQRLRGASDLPIIALGGRQQVDDLVRTLEAGADDYLAKPFHHRELMARLHALLRRAGVSRPLPPPRNFGDLGLDEEHSEAVLGSHRVHLSHTEFRLLSYFVWRARDVVPAEELLQQVWSRGDGDNPEVVRVAVHRLRRKLARLGPLGPTIRSQPGVGFAFEGAPGSALALQRAGSLHLGPHDHGEARDSAPSSEPRWRAQLPHGLRSRGR